ncbi:MAG: hypothetical protein M3235_06620, partial [Actinomycetota bacterium]|nr:hypothetical protein [Actinomycetota bacterium]
DYAAGGATIRQNVGPVCATDHQLKHRAGWEASRPGEPGTVVWRSPLGGVYTATGEFLTGPVLDPRPAPVPPPATDVPDHFADQPILRRPPPTDRTDDTDDTDGTRAPPELPDAEPPF